ncbi:MAG TPA: sn-glycerol-3-phosphate ABC transporter ATP-binding protein UgpC [Gemmatimonadaceae bacterium]|nr:sn-glycerol-3-phosphate ABC transporter ATP-binding protein UgpC [Gemmatimonadaceae bacterium]
MARVTLEKVRKIYDGQRPHVAVHGVDLEIADGEFVVLVGPSGCGKSTTLRMIAGLESISDGRLSIGDRVVNQVPAKERDIAMVFQNYALYPHMTVFENMAFALKMRRLPKGEIEKRVKEAAQILGLQGVLDRTPRQLSGGQRQRVAVGRAIVRKPQVFLFDEPLSNLDAKLRVQMRREISRLHQQLGATMVYVTHDQVEAMTLGDRIVVLNEGKVQQIDTPLALYDRPKNKFVAGFIGSPAMNFIDGNLLNDDGLRFRSKSGGVDVPLSGNTARALAGRAGTPLILGVRPEDVRVWSVGEDKAVDARARIDLVEPMGNEIFLHGSADADELTARVAPQTLPAVGEDVAFLFDRAKLHFFDPESQERIG